MTVKQVRTTKASVAFKNIGRDKLTYDTATTSLYDIIEGDFLSCNVRGLMSSHIDFESSENDFLKGRVLVGGFRHVGDYEIVLEEDMA